MSARSLFDRLFRLDGSVALVTGGTSGIGLATATVLASAGAKVIVTGRRERDPDQVAEGLRRDGLDVVGMACDLHSADELTSVVALIGERYGTVDAVVCNAGTALDTGPHTTSTDDQLDEMVNLHVRSPLRVANLTIPLMAERGSGSFVVMSSLAALRGNRMLGLYGVTKAANAQLARNLAVQWGPQGVRVNAVAPGVVETAFATSITEDTGRRTARLERTPLRRFGTPEEVAATIAWLVSPGGAFVTGQTIVIDGGTLIYD